MRVYLALASLALVVVGAMTWVGFSPGGLLPHRWSVLPLVLGLLGFVGSVVGQSFARVVLAGIGVMALIAGLVLALSLASVTDGMDRAAMGVLSMAVAGAASIWLAWAVPRRRPRDVGMEAPGPTGGVGTRERWWKSRWWLAIAVTGFPFLVGALAATATVLGNGPAATGCGVSGERLLRVQGHGLAEQLPGIRLGPVEGCDSGDSAGVTWEHDNLNQLVASAHTAGCRDAYLEEWDGQYQVLVCGAGPTQLILSIDIDSDGPGASGSISLNR